MKNQILAHPALAGQHMKSVMVNFTTHMTKKMRQSIGRLASGIGLRSDSRLGVVALTHEAERIDPATGREMRLEAETAFGREIFAVTERAHTVRESTNEFVESI